jgi:hypothetical protein
VPAGRAFTDEITTTEPPEQLVRRLLHDGATRLDRAGYSIESHSPTGVVLSRRYVPSPVYRVPLGLAVAAFLLGLANGNAAPAGSFAGVMILLAVVLSIAVRSSERATLTITPSVAGGSSVLASGRATHELRAYLADLATAPASPSATAGA